MSLDEIKTGTCWEICVANLGKRSAVIQAGSYDSCIETYDFHDTSSCAYLTAILILSTRILLQIHIDIPRMSPNIPLFRQKVVQKMFERILFIWSVRHPASGYVQGINDLVTPFFIVFLYQVLGNGKHTRRMKP